MAQRLQDRLVMVGLHRAPTHGWRYLSAGAAAGWYAVVWLVLPPHHQGRFTRYGIRDILATVGVTAVAAGIEVTRRQLTGSTATDTVVGPAVVWLDEPTDQPRERIGR